MDSSKLFSALQHVRELFSGNGRLKPLLSDFIEKWSRRIKGIKFPEDIAEDTLIEILTYKFLCDINFFFYMLLTDQLQLYYALLKELEKEGREAVEGNDQTENVADLWATLNNALLSSDISSKHKVLLNALEESSIEAFKMQLIFWMMLSKQLEHLEYEHQTEIRRNRRNAIDGPTSVLEHMLEDERLSARHSEIDALYQRHMQRVAAVNRELAKTDLSLEELRASTDEVNRLFDEDRQDIYRFMDKHPNETRAYRELINNNYHMHDQRLDKINKKFETLKAITRAQLAESCEQSKESSKALLLSIDALITEAENALGPAASNHLRVLHGEIAEYIRQLDNADTPERLQRILADCAGSMGQALDPLKVGGNPPKVIERLEDARSVLQSLGTQPPVEYDLWKKDRHGAAISSELEALQGEAPVLREKIKEVSFHLKPTHDLKTPAEKTAAMREQASSLRSNGQDSGDEFIAKMREIKDLWNDAKADADDPLEISEESKREIDMLFQEMENRELDISKLEQVEIKLREIKCSNPDNESCEKSHEKLMGFMKEFRGPDEAMAAARI